MQPGREGENENKTGRGKEERKLKETDNMREITEKRYDKERGRRESK